MEKVVIPAEPTAQLAPGQQPDGTIQPLTPETPPSTEATSERPEWLPEKFKTPEDLAKAYKELESKLGESPKEELQTQAEEAVTQAGLDFTQLSQEFAQTGELSAEAYDKLAKAGITKEMVDAYIEGQSAISARQQQEIFSECNGQDGYQAMIDWAKDNLSEADRVAFNNAIATPDLGIVKLAVRGLYAKFTATNGSPEPTLLTGQTGPVSQGVYRSTAEVVAAMSDPRYSKDPAYRKDVEQRLMRSNIF